MTMFGGFLLCITNPTITAARTIAAAMTETISPIDANDKVAAAPVDLVFVSGELVGVELGSVVMVGVDVGVAVGVGAGVGVGV